MTVHNRKAAGTNVPAAFFLPFAYLEALCSMRRANAVDWNALRSAGVSSIATMMPTTALIRLETMLAALPTTAGTNAEPTIIIPMIFSPMYIPE